MYEIMAPNEFQITFCITFYVLYLLYITVAVQFIHSERCHQKYRRQLLTACNLLSLFQGVSFSLQNASLVACPELSYWFKAIFVATIWEISTTRGDYR